MSNRPTLRRSLSVLMVGVLLFVGSTSYLALNRSHGALADYLSGQITVYSDGFLGSGFSDSQWTNANESQCILDRASTEQELNGKKSLKLNIADWCAYLAFNSGFVLSNYQFLEFDMYASAPVLPTFLIRLLTNSYTPSGTGVSLSSYITPAASWQHVKIPLGDLGLASTSTVVGVHMWSNTNTTRGDGDIYISDLQFNHYVDTTPPTIASVQTSDLSHFKVTFSESVNASEASDPSNYFVQSTVDPAYIAPLTPSSVQAFSASVYELTFSVPLQDKTVYSIRGSGIHDTPPNSEIPNLINSTIATSFTTALSQIAIAIDAATNVHPISPEIYGLAFASPTKMADLNFTVNRQGGNASTGGNWQDGTYNHASDWFYESIGNKGVADLNKIVNGDKAAGASSALTVSLIDWAAKVKANGGFTSSFSQAKYGPQQSWDQWFADAGNGVLTNGQKVVGNDPNDAYKPVTSDFAQQMVKHLVDTFGIGSIGGVKHYIMDNEPSLWSFVHRDIVPTGVKMSELRDRIIEYSAKVKAADPSAVVQGPEEWGWAGYFNSGFDQQYSSLHGSSVLPDRVSRGGMDSLPWLLQQLYQHDQQTGSKSLDMFSLHYYPQSGEYSNSLSQSKQLLRNVSTRSLWDPNYVDKSWINSKVQLIPRMKDWVHTYYPGLKTGITEYNWGGENGMNGATTEADILGIFGREGLDAANYWAAPSATSPTYAAMKMYRNYDGAKSTFGETSVSDVVPNPDQVSSFASLRSDGALTVMLINKNLSTDTAVTLNLANFTNNGLAQVYQQTTGATINHAASVKYANGVLNTYLPQQSVTLLVFSPQPAANFSMKLQRRTSDQSLQGVKVTVKNTGSSTVLTEATGALDSSGMLSITDSTFLSLIDTTSTYDVTVDAPGFVPVTVTGVSHLLKSTTDFGTALIGNFSGKGIVSLSDLVLSIGVFHGGTNPLITTAFGHSLTLADLVILIANYRKFK